MNPLTHLLLFYLILPGVPASHCPTHLSITVVTDPHGFFTSESVHRVVPSFDADYASVVDFAQRLKANRSLLGEGKENHAVLLLENGDTVDGGGLSDAPGAKHALFGILDSIPFDGRTFGNHELYDVKTLEALKGFLPGEFVTSNVVDPVTMEPYGARFKVVLLDKACPHRTVIMGFLYDMTDNQWGRVERVEDAVRAEWFKRALVDEPDLTSLVVMAHMGASDHLVRVILERVRQLRGSTFPVLFVTGHTHVRATVQLDDYALSFEAGRYLDTVGLVSFPIALPSAPPVIRATQFKFNHRYIDAKRSELHKITHHQTDTTTALHLREKLLAARKALDLDRVIGHSDKTYKLNPSALKSSESIIRFWVDEIVEYSLLNSGLKCPQAMFIGGTGSIRFDLYTGNITSDDLFAVAPFAEAFYVVRCVDGIRLQKVLRELWLYAGPMKRNPLFAALPRFAFSTRDISPRESYDVVFGLYDQHVIVSALSSVGGGIPVKTEEFRKDEINAHSVWVEYFLSKTKTENIPVLLAALTTTMAVPVAV